MADVTGPISSLPGSSHDPPKGTMCDDHPDRLAVARIQGETDSFGSEMHDYCEQCIAELKKEREEAKLIPHKCDWCKTETLDCRPTRDYDEGMSGRVYDVCAKCRKRVDDEAREELKQYGDDYDDFD